MDDSYNPAKDEKKLLQIIRVGHDPDMPSRWIRCFASEILRQNSLIDELTLERDTLITACEAQKVRIQELEDNWTEVTGEETEPPQELLNSLGNGRFLCLVVNRGTMIEASRLEMVWYSKEDGFDITPFDKHPLVTGVTHWSNIIPPKEQQ